MRLIRLSFYLSIFAIIPLLIIVFWSLFFGRPVQCFVLFYHRLLSVVPVHHDTTRRWMMIGDAASQPILITVVVPAGLGAERC